MRLLFVGDVVGDVGRRALESTLPGLIEEHSPDFVVVNGENAAGGLGITEKIALGFYELGVDAITLGNHTYRHKSVYGFLDTDERIVRPANYFKGDPGRGHCVVEKDGRRLAVVNLSGNVFLDAARSAFSEIDAVLDSIDADWTLLDFHAEATSEKVGMGWHVDGRVTACVGTHTHVPTNDFRVLPGGTAYITDVGMTGPRGGVIGVKKEQAVKRFMTMAPVRFETSEDDPWLMGVLIEANDDGRAQSIEPVIVPAS